MPERIYKLQPNRTIQLRGFDDLGASAAVHSTTANSFKVSGTFRDAADFAVLILYDADNFYEHPRLKYLPNLDFDGLTLTFDVHYTNLMPLDSPRFPTIAWPFLQVTRDDATGSSVDIRLFDPSRATQVGGTYTAASGSYTILANQIKQFDSVTIWYLNFAFEYSVPQIECAYAFVPSGTVGTLHSITVDGAVYSTAEAEGDTPGSIAQRLVPLVDASPKVSASGTFQVDIRNKADDGSTYTVSSTGGASATLYGIGPNYIASFLASLIQNANYSTATIGLSAFASGSTIHIQAARPGIDGNSITLYSVATSSRLQAQTTGGGSVLALAGGSSDATWRITLDFTALGITQIRRMLLTFAPPVPVGAPLQTTEWLAEFTNWTLSATGPNPEAKKMLQVAAPGSVRVEENDSWCSYTGSSWVPLQEEIFFSGGYARRASAINDTVTVRYSCASEHDLYIGTSLYINRATVGVRLDGDTETLLDCARGFRENPLTPEAEVNTRRKVRSNVPAGEHVVTIRQATAGFFYFDFLEAAVLGDVPDALPAVSRMSPALDYSTDHTYKLPPERILWIFDQLGFTGPMNEYIGVFWWNQRKWVGPALPSITVTFDGTFVPGDVITLAIGGTPINKLVRPAETLPVFASHFAYAINATYVGVYAVPSGNSVTITARSLKPAYAFNFSSSTTSATGTVSPATASLSNSVPGIWEVDPSQATILNRGARDWHAAMFAGCKARNREITVASSMELVNAPPGFAAKFLDGDDVVTAVEFGTNLRSAHCAFCTPMLNYQKRVFKELADLQSAALLTPSLQLGEFLWWFFSNWSAVDNPDGGMGFYDAETTAAAAAALGRPLHAFIGPHDDPSVNSGADATFLRNRLRDHAAAIIAHVKTTHPTAAFELLFPYDVNHPVPVGSHNLGGALNRFVNFPTEWQSKPTSGLDRIKMESLDFGAWQRNLDLCGTTMRFPIQLGWPMDSIRYLIAVFRPGAAWEREYLLARGLEIPIINFWAFDHVCIFGLDPREPQNHGRGTST